MKANQNQSLDLIDHIHTTVFNRLSLDCSLQLTNCNTSQSLTLTYSIDKLTGEVSGDILDAINCCERFVRDSAAITLPENDTRPPYKSICKHGKYQLTCVEKGNVDLTDGKSTITIFPTIESDDSSDNVKLLIELLKSSMIKYEV